jgi:hypothetical protein
MRSHAIAAPRSSCSQRARVRGSLDLERFEEIRPARETLEQRAARRAPA